MRKLRNKWYARVYIWDGYRETEKQIPLKTQSKTTARIRLEVVKRYENDIKNGLRVTFPWQNNEGQLKYKQTTITEMQSKFIASRKTLGLAESTLKRNRHSLDLFIKIIGSNTPINKIDTSNIEMFKEYSINKLNHSQQGTNIDLRLLKTFFRWCNRNEFIKNVPDVQMIKIPQALPSYLSELEWSQLISLDDIEDIYKKTFIFAFETGCRRSEPYYGNINGHWLLIPAEHTKSKIEKEVFLTDELIGIWYEMTNHLQNWLGRGYKRVNYVDKVSKIFKKACRSININNHFHDLRHTFAVRRYLQTRDIYQVKKELGHTSVTTTEKYAKFSLRRLAHDFPSLSKSIRNTDKNAITDTVYTDTSSYLLKE